MLNITNQKGNASQNYSEIPLYIHRGVIILKQKVTGVGEDMEKL